MRTRPPDAFLAASEERALQTVVMKRVSLTSFNAFRNRSRSRLTSYLFYSKLNTRPVLLLLSQAVIKIQL